MRYRNALFEINVFFHFVYASGLPARNYILEWLALWKRIRKFSRSHTKQICKYEVRALLAGLSFVAAVRSGAKFGTQKWSHKENRVHGRVDGSSL